MSLANLFVFSVVLVFTNSAAQIFLKMGSAFRPFSVQWLVFFSSSLVFYFFSFFGYSFLLKFVDISKISPVMMVGTSSLIALYGYGIGEPFGLRKMVGIVLAVFSVLLISRS